LISLQAGEANEDESVEGEHACPEGGQREEGIRHPKEEEVVVEEGGDGY